MQLYTNYAALLKLVATTTKSTLRGVATGVIRVVRGAVRRKVGGGGAAWE